MAVSYHCFLSFASPIIINLTSLPCCVRMGAISPGTCLSDVLRAEEARDGEPHRSAIGQLPVDTSAWHRGLCRGLSRRTYPFESASRRQSADDDAERGRSRALSGRGAPHRRPD